MSESGDETPPVYRFADFTLDVGERLLLEGERVIPLQRKAFEVLVVLVENGGRLVTKDALLDRIWGETFVEEGNLHANVAALRKALGDSRATARFIKTVPGSGYRFVAKVRLDSGGPDQAPRPPAHEERPVSVPEASRTGAPEASVPISEDSATGSVEGAPRLQRRAGVAVHGTIAIVLYALLYVVALFVEIAYDYDRLGALAWRLAPWVFGWTSTTTLAALWIASRLARNGKSAGLAAAVAVIVAAGLGLALVLHPLLPPEAVTRANIYTSPASAAYLKSCFYFVVLGVIFVATPFHVVTALDEAVLSGDSKNVSSLLRGRRTALAPAGALYLPAKILLLILAGFAALTAYGAAHLLDNLKSAPRAGLFTELYFWRICLFFVLGAECSIWYRLATEGLRARAARALSPPSREALPVTGTPDGEGSRAGRDAASRV